MVPMFIPNLQNFYIEQSQMVGKTELLLQKKDEYELVVKHFREGYTMKFFFQSIS